MQLFLLEKCENLQQCKNSFAHFSIKNNSVLDNVVKIYLTSSGLNKVVRPMDSWPKVVKMLTSGIRKSDFRPVQTDLDSLGPFYFTKNVKKSVRKLTFFR